MLLHPETDAKRLSLGIKTRNSAAHPQALLSNGPKCFSPQPVSGALRLAPVLPTT